MGSTVPLQPTTRIDEVASGDPGLGRALRANGIDLCCGGSLTLADACEIRGVSLAKLLGDLEAARRAGAGGVPVPAAPVSAALVLAEPVPAVPVPAVPTSAAAVPAAAASVSPVPVSPVPSPPSSAVVAGAPPRPAVRLTVETSPQPAAAPQPSESSPRLLTPPFVVAALACTLTLGAANGAYALVARHLLGWTVTPVHRWSHAGFQVVGFVLLFTVGVSLHVVPRFVGARLAFSALARATLPLALVGLTVRSYGLCGERLVPFAAQAVLAGSALQLLAVVSWSVVLAATARRGRGVEPGIARLLVAGTAWWIAAAALLALGGVAAVATGSVAATIPWSAPAYAAALQGGALLWIEGVFLRAAPNFLGLAPVRSSLVPSMRGLAQAGAFLSVLGALEPTAAGAALAASSGAVATGVSVLLLAATTRILERSPSPAAWDAQLGFALRVPFAGGALCLVLATAQTAVVLAGVRAPDSLADGIRHAFGLGFVALFIFGMASRIVPTAIGRPLVARGLVPVGGTLVLLGVLLRQVGIVAEVGADPSLFRVLGVSGVVAAAGTLALAIPLLATLASWRRGARSRPWASSLPQRP